MRSSSAGPGWIIIAKFKPVKLPASSIRIFPPPPSSAGVPRALIVIPSSSAKGASAAAAR